MSFNVKRLIRKLRFYGSKFNCPICQSRLRKLRPFGFDFPVLKEKNVIGGGFRLNAQCPVCKSTDRERLLYLYLSKISSLSNGNKKLLHVAPEPRLRDYLRGLANVDYLDADLNAEKCHGADGYKPILIYPDEYFDVIICNHVLEHIIDDLKAMRELFRVMKTGGWGILQVPVSASLQNTFEDATVVSAAQREVVFGQSDHVRIYASDYIQRLEESGFKVGLFKWWDHQEFVNGDCSFGLLDNESILYFT